MYKGLGVRFADLFPFFLKYPLKISGKGVHRFEGLWGSLC